MPSILGESLVERRLITQSQLEESIERQKVHGGRLGENLIALGYVAPGEAEQFFQLLPNAPRSVAETKLGLSFIVDLVVKHMSLLGECSLSDIVTSTKLTLSVVDEAIGSLRRERLVEVRGSGVTSELGYKFALTDSGKGRANALFELSRYVGPAPVVLTDYREMVEIQTIKSIIVGIDNFMGEYLGGDTIGIGNSMNY